MFFESPTCSWLREWLIDWQADTLQVRLFISSKLYGARLSSALHIGHQIIMGFKTLLETNNIANIHVLHTIWP